MTTAHHLPTGTATRLAGRLADRRLLVALLVAWVGLAGLMFATDGHHSIAAVEERCGAAPPDVRPYTSPSEVRDFLAGCGAEGRHLYRDLQIVDLAYPAVFGLLLATALALLLRAGTADASRGAAWAVLPLLAAAADYAENASAWALLRTAPDPAGWATWTIGIASVLKQAATWASVVLLIGLLALRAARRLRHREPAPSAA